MKIAINYKNGDKYFGEVKNKLMHGNGELRSENYIYKGFFFENKFEGFGKLSYTKNNKFYKGYFKNNKKCGLGILQTNSFTFMGQFKDDKFEGYGKIFDKYVLYEGLFRENKKEGIGIEIYKNSDFYIGNFKNNEKNGLGIYFYAKGGYYHGFFKNNLLNDFGFIQNTNSITYTGNFKDGNKEGLGIINYGKKKLYSGEFKNDKKEGVGMFQYNENLIYIGEMKENKKNGDGCLTNLKNKKNYFGKFENDSLLELDIRSDKIFLKYSNFEFIKSLKEYLKIIKFKKINYTLKNNENLEEFFVEPLLIFLKKYVFNNYLEPKIYLRIINILENEINPIFILKNLEKVLYLNKEDIYNFQNEIYLGFELNKFKNLKWETFEIIIGKNREFKDHTIKNFIITNHIMFGEFDGKKCKGIIFDNKCFKLNLFDENNNKIDVHEGQFGANFLSHFNKDKKFFVSFLKSNEYKGTFQIDNINYKYSIRLHLSIIDDFIFNIGSDSIGNFIIIGKINKMNFTFSQKYYLGYEIIYQGIINDNKLVF